MPLSTAPEPEKRTPRYSFDWAIDVVKRARGSYPRAWQILDPWFNLTERQLAYLLACDAPEWAQIREMTHQCDRWLTKQTRVGPPIPISGWSTTQTYSALLKIVKNRLGESLHHYLQGRIKELRMKEQLKEGSGVASSTPDLPFGEAG